MGYWKGGNPQRAGLTGQPSGQHAMHDVEAVRVMDELVLHMLDRNPRLSAAGVEVASAWRDGMAAIRDYAHCGGADSRMHITVLNDRNNRHYHIPVISHVPGQWEVDLYEIVTV